MQHNSCRSRFKSISYFLEQYTKAHINMCKLMYSTWQGNQISIYKEDQLLTNMLQHNQECLNCGKGLQMKLEAYQVKLPLLRQCTNLFIVCIPQNSEQYNNATIEPFMHVIAAYQHWRFYSQQLHHIKYATFWLKQITFSDIYMHTMNSKFCNGKRRPTYMICADEKSM